MRRNADHVGVSHASRQAALVERLEDSTELLRSFIGSYADEYGMVTTQVAENELTLRDLSPDLKSTTAHGEKRKLCNHRQRFDLLSPSNPGNTWYTEVCTRPVVEGTEFCSDHQPPK